MKLCIRCALSEQDNPYFASRLCAPLGHVRTQDFRSFEPNPHNPIFTPAADRGAWDCDGILTPQVFEAGDAYYMLYAGRKGREWQSGLARADKPRG